MAEVRALAEFSDAEIILVAVIMESGGAFKPKDPMDAETAVVLNRMLAYAVQQELERRELDPMRMATALMGRVCERLPKEV